jgi:beta-glucanase (GH16 family)
LPGQRWSACTCRGEDHPGPSTNKGRGSPEIDIIEAQINIADAIGEVSQSLQTAPFDDFYQFDNTSNNIEQYYPLEMQPNTYLGGVYQQAVSVLVNTDRQNYRANGGGFGVYGFEYTANPDAREDGYVTWVSSGKPSWTMRAGATDANPRTQISRRPVPEEPMTIILNFGEPRVVQTLRFGQPTNPSPFPLAGMSNNFQAVDFDNLVFVRPGGVPE